MKLNNYICISVLIIFQSCTILKKNNTNSNIENDILRFYFKEHEITEKQKNDFKSNFSKLSTKTKFGKYENDSDGKFIEISFFSLNVSETTTHLLLVSNFRYKFVEISNNYNGVLKEIKRFDKYKLFDDYNEILIRIKSIDESNQKLRNSNILLPYNPTARICSTVDSEEMLSVPTK